MENPTDYTDGFDWSSRIVRGKRLRYLLTDYIHRWGTKDVETLAIELAEQGCEFAGRPTKAISDALRAEVERGRILRLQNHRYGPGDITRQTELRMHQRALAIKRESLHAGNGSRYD